MSEEKNSSDRKYLWYFSDKLEVVVGKNEKLTDQEG